MTRLRIGTRGSRLALIQTDLVVARLRRLDPALQVERRVITTKPDRNPDVPIAQMGDKALFVLDIEAALRAGEIDVAVHSLKDVPIAPSPGLEIAAVTERADPRDVLVSHDGSTLATLPPGSVIGTSSLRRAGQVLARRPDLRPQGVRGNVDTRLRKLRDGEVDALVLAAAGLIRLGLEEAIAEPLAAGEFVPAPGQGALAVQCRVGSDVAALIALIDDATARSEVEAERAFASALGADCRTPVGAWARRTGDRLQLVGEVCDVTGARFVRVEGVGDAAQPRRLGRDLAARALRAGAQTLLAG